MDLRMHAEAGRQRTHAIEKDSGNIPRLDRRQEFIAFVERKMRTKIGKEDVQ